MHTLIYHATHAHSGYGKHDLLILLHLLSAADQDEQGVGSLYDSRQHHTL